MDDKMDVEALMGGAKQGNAAAKRPTESGDPKAKAAARGRASKPSQGSQFAELTAAAKANIPGNLGPQEQPTVPRVDEAPGVASMNREGQGGRQCMPSGNVAQGPGLAASPRSAPAPGAGPGTPPTLAPGEDKPGEGEPGEGGGEDDDMGTLANGAARGQELSEADQLRVVQAIIAMTVDTLNVPEDALRDPLTGKGCATVQAVFDATAAWNRTQRTQRVEEAAQTARHSLLERAQPARDQQQREQSNYTMERTAAAKQQQEAKDAEHSATAETKYYGKLEEDKKKSQKTLLELNKHHKDAAVESNIVVMVPHVSSTISKYALPFGTDVADASRRMMLLADLLFRWAQMSADATTDEEIGDAHKYYFPMGYDAITLCSDKGVPNAYNVTVCVHETIALAKHLMASGMIVHIKDGPHATGASMRYAIAVERKVGKHLIHIPDVITEVYKQLRVHVAGVEFHYDHKDKFIVRLKIDHEHVTKANQLGGVTLFGEHKYTIFPFTPNPPLCTFYTAGSGITSIDGFSTQVAPSLAGTLRLHIHDIKTRRVSGLSALPDTVVLVHTAPSDPWLEGQIHSLSAHRVFRLYPKLQQDHIPPPKGWAGISVKIATDLGDLQASLGYPILRAPRFDDDGEPEEGDPRPTVAPSASARCVSPTTLYAGDTVAQGASTDLSAGDETPA